MTAWQKLLAASSLMAGTAWQLISNPKTGGAGLVVNDGIAVSLEVGPLAALVPLDPLEALVGDRIVADLVVDRDIGLVPTKDLTT